MIEQGCKVKAYTLLHHYFMFHKNLSRCRTLCNMKKNETAMCKVPLEEKKNKKEKEKATKVIKVKKEPRGKNRPAKKTLVSDISDPNNNSNEDTQSSSDDMEKENERVRTRGDKRKNSARVTKTKKAKSN